MKVPPRIGQRMELLEFYGASYGKHIELLEVYGTTFGNHMETCENSEKHSWSFMS